MFCSNNVGIKTTTGIKYLALCLGGCEEEIVADIKKCLSHRCDETSKDNFLLDTEIFESSYSNSVAQGESGCGKLLVQSNLDVEKVMNITKVRSVQYWLFSVFNSDNKCKATLNKNLNETNDFMAYLRDDCLADVDWNSFADLLRRVPRVQQLDKYREFRNCERPARFCVRCIRDGKHAFKSIDVAKKVGEIVLEKTDWKVDLTQMDIEIVVLLSGDKLHVGISIPSESQPFLRAHLPSEIRLPVVSSKISPSLRPSTAYVMVMLAQPIPGEIVVDCMCGSGAAMIEAAYSHGCIALGGDVDMNLRSTLLETTGHAANMSTGLTKAEPLFWSAHALPLQVGCTDIVILDLPFGPAAKKTPPLYRSRVPKFVIEIARILRPSVGRCVLLSQTLQQLQVCLDSHYFCDFRSREVNIGGYSCFLVIANRSSIPWGSNSSGGNSDGCGSSGSSSTYASTVDALLSGESSEQPSSKRVKTF